MCVCVCVCVCVCAFLFVSLMHNVCVKVGVFVGGMSIAAENNYKLQSTFNSQAVGSFVRFAPGLYDMVVILW